jgi:PHD/YefM family antitoxin component YafN of YafNO toxin-antitoxin module
MAKQILSDDARKRFREVIDDIQQNNEHYLVLRYQTPSAMIVPVNWFERAKAALDLVSGDTTVVLATTNANEADRLRRLAREHGSLGLPFPNNSHPTWRVVDEAGRPVGSHSIPSVGVAVVDEQRQ